ncbi:hypothetical protein CFC21_058841 [Triticum aestivum]|uniref:Uncharacterized protein n=2 Tax=Triticum aestivum TaxID=4565 RepID=A0A9R1GNX8_WHEAT|nr:uncharacterized protein LOC123089235 [Triticum aestivum]KAF7050474.1 hypothetical protein CFC21_058841 [Triticum aestivum]
MADIAMLVAEEHEKRLKRGAPRVAADEEASKGKVNFGAVTKVWGSWAESAAAAASGVKVHVAVLVRSDLVAAEPRSPVARAAFDGFFSA